LEKNVWQRQGYKMNRERLYEEIKSDEGEILEVYKDHLGYATIGIGHLVTEQDEEFGEPTGTPITAERSRELFDRDVECAIKDCERLYGQWHNWPEEVQLILVNMAFNLGAPRLAKFKNMQNMLSQGKWKEAAVEGRDSLWYRQVTNRAERLMRRLENV
jgi:GH24 family phage-related lysozyme (muramidase)